MINKNIYKRVVLIEKSPIFIMLSSHYTFFKDYMMQDVIVDGKVFRNYRTANYQANAGRVFCVKKCTGFKQINEDDMSRMDMNTSENHFSMYYIIQDGEHESYIIRKNKCIVLDTFRYYSVK